MGQHSSSMTHQRIWLAALLPAIAIALVLTAWHARHRATEIETQARNHAAALTRQFSALVGPQVRRIDRPRLRATAQAIADYYPLIEGVTITDHEGWLLARVGRAESASAPAGEPTRLEQPIVAEAGDSPVGHFSVHLDLSDVYARQHAVYWESAGLAAVMAVLATAAGVWLMRGSGRARALLSRHRTPDWRGIGQLHPDDVEDALDRLRRDNQRLDAARRKAEAASERKSRYLADIGHEIRTPMNAILGFTELMERDDRRAQNANHIATIRDSVRGLIGLLNGMLDISKADAGRLKLDYRDVDVNALVEEMFRLFAPQTFAKGVEMVVTPAPSEFAGVRTDAMRLKQILVNLLSNAIRFTSAGYIRVGAEIVGRTESHVRVRFVVEDTGCGIPEACQPQLFEAFTQGERAVSDPHAPALEAGTGLGLSIAGELAALLGGRLEFRSELERGSTFWLTLDLSRTSQNPATPTAPAIRRRVALIDRDVITREWHAQMLARAGISVELIDEAGWGEVTAPDCFDAIVVPIPAQEVVRGDIAPPDPRLRRAAIPLVAFAYEYDRGLQAALWRAGYPRILAKTADPEHLREGLEVALVAAPIPPTDDSVETETVHRVLVVDDHPVNLRLVRDYLGAAGITADTASTSDEALRRAADVSYDAILLDLRLPDRDGCHTARLLRAREGPNRASPIIAVTADCPTAETERVLDAGCDDLLGKPVAQEILLERLRTWIPALLPETGDDDLPVLDPAEALNRARGKPELAEELYATLRRTLPHSRHSLTLARLKGDHNALHAEVHRLRGAVVYCGVPRLEAAVAHLDRTLLDGDEIAQSRALQRLEREIATVQARGEPRDESSRSTPAPGYIDNEIEARPPA